MSDTLEQFVGNVSGKSRLRVEEDLGGGFVRLQISEAERRQAIQDIRSSEDIVLELLRNARDAHAHHIFLAFSHEGNTRLLTVIDDGEGIPADMHRTVFEPRVTSKLDTSHIDEWGYHGRGMALYSISVNAETAEVLSSDAGLGCALGVTTDLRKLKEKKDQSTFPRFSFGEDGAVHVTGPKNIMRVSCEFAIKVHAECSVYVGSQTEIAATLYELGAATLSSTERAFTQDLGKLAVTKRLAASGDSHEFANIAETLGLAMSDRSARRIMDGEVEPAESLLDRIVIEKPSGSPSAGSKPSENGAHNAHNAARHRAKQLKISAADRALLKTSVQRDFADIAERYYLSKDVEPRVGVSNNMLHISIPLVPYDEQ